MNPQSLDSSIQSALSALFPPFEATAPIVLSQLFRTIEDRYHGDALHCLLDFLIPSKHLLESVQQAACAAYSDVLFRHEGWPLCLHDKTVIQLAPLNPLLLRPGDFYLQVEPFGDQAARVVLKSLLQERCREVEETPIPETSYSCIFTQEWLQDVNEGRHGAPLSRCLLSTDQGVIKLPWANVAVPEFLDKPRNVHTSLSVTREAQPEPRPVSVPSHFNASTLPMEAMILHRDRMQASLRHVDSSSKLVKMDYERIKPKSSAKPLVKPVGWVSPNTWDSRTYGEVEGDYVDLVDFAKGEEALDKQDSHATPPSSVVFKPVRPPPPVPVGRSAPCGHTRVEEPCAPCYQRGLGLEPTDGDLKCRYRESYLAALRNPVAFEQGSVDLLAALEEVGVCDEFRSKCTHGADKDELGEDCEHCKEPTRSHESCQRGERCEPAAGTFEPQLKELPDTFESGNCRKESSTNHSQEVQTSLVSHQVDHESKEHELPDAPSPFLQTGEAAVKHQKPEEVKPSGKHKVKLRSPSSVSETPKGAQLLHKLNTRSHSDICPETISSMMRSKRATRLHQAGINPKIDSRLIRCETPSAPDGDDSRLHSSRTHSAPSPGSDAPQAPTSEDSSFRSVVGLLQLGIICLPGSRDRTGRAVLEVHGDRKEWTSPLVSAQKLCQLLLYLQAIPRRDVGELGMTLVIDARKKSPPLHLYRALLMAQEQALHAVHSILVLVDKDTCPRPEKQQGLQMDLVTSLKALNKTVESPQLSSDLGGSFTYTHTDWLQFHQRLAPFMSDLRGADALLQRNIRRVDRSQDLETIQDVQLCIEEHRASMKEVLEDARLVALQREGGAVLARMKKEEFRFRHSEDCRDALDSVTTLYNQVEEKLHTLVMRSNESLQQLDFLFRLREMEGSISTAGSWFHAEGEQRLKESYSAADTLDSTETASERFDLILTQAKEKRREALTLVLQAERIVGNSDSTPTTDVFRTVVSTFKSDMENFMLRAEQRHRDLDSLVLVYRFSQQAAALAKECHQSLEQVESGCDSIARLTSLQMYAERLSGEFSGPHFQAVKAKACAVSSGASGGMRAWNAAWVQCQEVRPRLEEMLSRRGGDKRRYQQEQRAGASGGDKKVGRSEMGETECSLIKQLLCDKEDINIPESVPGGTADTSVHLKGGAPQPPAPEHTAHNETTITAATQNGGRGRPREHQSEADLRSAHATEGHRPLGRSLSEGACSGSILTSDLSPLAPGQNLCHKQTQPSLQNQQLVQNLPVPSSQSSPSRNSICEASRVAEAERGDLSPTEALLTDTPTPEDNGSNVLKLRRVMEELLSTEREYVKALGYVREHYFPELERADVPQDLRGQRGSVFGNLEKLHDFHRHHFLEELQGCVNEPFRVGRCFLRHRENFALYALYSKNKPQSDSLLINHGQAFFKQKQLELRDQMDLWSYLLKPVQRISKYSLLLQDLMRECGPAQSRELEEVKAALEVVHFQLRHGNNLLAMDAIQHCDVNLKEQGQLIRQEEFLVTFRKKKCFRHIFLFQELVLFSKTKKTGVGNDTYVYKQSFKTSDIGMTQNSGDSGLCFEIWFRKRKTQDTYTLQAASRHLKEAWTRDLERILWEQAVHNREVRMQERVFMGLGNKPFMDIQPSDAAISDRAVNYVLMGKEGKVFSSRGSQDELLGRRPNSMGSGSSSSSSGSHSSSSSGRGSLSSAGYLCGPKRRASTGGLGGYVAPPGVLEEDDLDHESGSHHLLLDSSESSGESVSGFSSSGQSYHSALGGEAEDASSLCSSTVTLKEGAEASTDLHTPKSPGRKHLPTAPKPHQKPPHQASEVQSSVVGKSTEV
ncbi:quattro [Genypterus blacodes]|uniref:quattro n=1 Tax=Genypterus blacodes TaxID=154954 RepID=UPI003F76ECC1